MTTWAQFRTDLKTAVQSLVDPDACQVVWRDQAQPYTPSKTLCRLNVQRVEGKLTERRYEPNALNPLLLDAVYYSAMQATVGFLFETVSQEDADTPLTHFDDISTFLQWTKINEDVSFKDDSPALDASVNVDDRLMQVYHYEATFNVLITEKRDAAGPPIQAVELALALEGTDGTEVDRGPYEISTGYLLAIDMTGETDVGPIQVEGFLELVDASNMSVILSSDSIDVDMTGETNVTVTLTSA